MISSASTYFYYWFKQGVRTTVLAHRRQKNSTKTQIEIRKTDPENEKQRNFAIDTRTPSKPCRCLISCLSFWARCFGRNDTLPSRQNITETGTPCFAACPRAWLEFPFSIRQMFCDQYMSGKERGGDFFTYMITKIFIGREWGNCRGTVTP